MRAFIFCFLMSSLQRVLMIEAGTDYFPKSLEIIHNSGSEIFTVIWKIHKYNSLFRITIEDPIKNELNYFDIEVLAENIRRLNVQITGLEDSYKYLFQVSAMKDNFTIINSSEKQAAVEGEDVFQLPFDYVVYDYIEKFDIEFNLRNIPFYEIRCLVRVTNVTTGEEIKIIERTLHQSKTLSFYNLKEKSAFNILASFYEPPSPWDESALTDIQYNCVIMNLRTPNSYNKTALTPHNVNITPDEEDTASYCLTWTTPNFDRINIYSAVNIVNLTNLENGDKFSFKIEEDDSEKMKVILIGLAENTSYNISVILSYEYGLIVRSQSIEFTTTNQKISSSKIKFEQEFGNFGFVNIKAITSKPTKQLYFLKQFSISEKSKVYNIWSNSSKVQVSGLKDDTAYAFVTYYRETSLTNTDIPILLLKTEKFNKPPKVMNLTAEKTDDKRFYLNWDRPVVLTKKDGSVLKLIEYKVIVTTKTSKHYKKDFNIPYEEDDKVKMILRHLFHCTHYRIEVTAHYEVEIISETALIDYETPEDVPLKASIRIEVKDRNISMTLKPNNYGCPPTGYVIRIYDGVADWDSTNGEVAEFKLFTNHYEVADLYPGMKYWIKYGTFNNIGMGDGGLFRKTFRKYQTNYGVSSVPQNFRVTQRTSHHIQLQWSKPANPAGYIRRYCVIKGIPPESSTYCVNSQVQQLQIQLIPTTNEDIRVAVYAENRDKNGTSAVINSHVE